MREANGTICSEIVVELDVEDAEKLTSDDLANQAEKKTEQRVEAMGSLTEVMDGMLEKFSDEQSIENMTPEQAKEEAQTVMTKTLSSLSGFSLLLSSGSVQADEDMDPTMAKLQNSMQLRVSQESNEEKEKTIENLDKSLIIFAKLAEKSGSGFKRHRQSYII